MGTPPISREVAVASKEAVEQCLREGYGPPKVRSRKGSAVEEAAKRLVAAGLLGSPNSMTSRIRGIALQGLEPDWSLYKPEKPRVRVKVHSARPVVPEPAPTISPEQIRADVMRVLRKQSMTIEEVASAVGIDGQAADEIVHSLRDAGVSLHQFAGKWHVTTPQASHLTGPRFEFVSRPDNTFSFGVTSDNHIGSKYARVDVLDDLYDRFERAGVQAVLNAGNWIDGEASFNKHDLVVHGMDAQLRLLAQQYPRRAGIKTYAVAGDDHEGWYAQREGVDIGRYAQRVMEDAGRDDWVDVGYMEAHFILRNANTEASAVMALVHPGGGSAYAISYSIQKIVEVLDGGEKPAVGVYGHYHKLWAGNIRNVWCLQSGCTQDATPFMRKKKLAAHVGGAIMDLEQDPETGAIIGFTPKMLRYFVRGYYENRWSHHGPVTLPERAA